MLARVQDHITWYAILIAGIVAGTVFLLINVILTPLVLEVSSELTLRYFGSLVLGSDVLTTGGSGVVVVGVIIHYILSLVFTLMIAIVIHQWGMLIGIVGGTILGLAIYSINLYTMTLFFDWFFAINSNVLLLSHAVFGAVAGGVYELFDHYDVAFIREEL